MKLLSRPPIPLLSGMLITLIILSLSVPSRAGSPRPGESKQIVIAFYNTENFFDTLPDPASSDNSYTPEGRYRWNSSRYQTKIRHIAQVLDTLRADIVGLAEIENENVLRDLVAQLQTSYNYIFEAGNDPRGINVALLYRGSLFFPIRHFQLKGPGMIRPALAVRGCLQKDTITLIVTHLPSLMNPNSWRKQAAHTLRTRIEELQQHHPEEKIMLMGDLNMTPNSKLARKELGAVPCPKFHRNVPANKIENHPLERMPLFSPFMEWEHRAMGSYVYRDRRYMYDQILFSPSCLQSAGWSFRGRCGLFAPDFLLQETGPKQGYPKRTFDRGNYIGGYSDHLPVWIVLEK